MINSILIASDHGGFELKQHLIPFLEAKGIRIIDMGPANADSVDYPDFAQKAAQAILDGAAPLGILACGTGIGISIAANRFKGIRCALCTSPQMAEMARRHNNANMLALGGRLITAEEAEAIVNTFLETGFDGERHARRILKIDNPPGHG